LSRRIHFERVLIEDHELGEFAGLTRSQEGTAVANRTVGIPSGPS
jgi:hypothetical protein